MKKQRLVKLAGGVETSPIDQSKQEGKTSGSSDTTTSTASTVTVSGDTKFHLPLHAAEISTTDSHVPAPCAILQDSSKASYDSKLNSTFNPPSDRKFGLKKSTRSTVVSERLEIRDTTPSSAAQTSNSLMALSTSPPTPNIAKIDKHKFSLNLVLENVLQVTYRMDAAIPPIKYIGTGDVDYISASKVSEIVFSKLTEGVEYGGAIGYLSNCFKRLLLKDSSEERMREDLAKYVKEIP